MNNVFKEIIGQEPAKNKLQFFLDSYNTKGYVPPILFTAAKGQGKTEIAKAFGRRLLTKEGETRPKRFLEINCSRLSTVSAFYDDAISKVSSGQEVTLFFDESSEIPKSITFCLLTILNTNSGGKNYYDFGNGQMIEFDLRKITWLFATSEPHKMFHALIDRLEHIDLVGYSEEEMSQILKLKMKGISVDPMAEKDIVSVLRGNARDATQWAEKLIMKAAQNNSKTITLGMWNDMKAQFGVLPLGLVHSELRILECLRESCGSRITDLAARTGLTRQAIQGKFETYLLNKKLIKTESSIRKLTPDGIRYLQSLEKKS